MRNRLLHQRPNIAFKALLLLLLITLAGFWPLVTGQFSVKNDDIIYFLPYRYDIVESIRNGYFPFWNPYIYMGMPLSGDMQSGVWNPVVWLLSITGRYTVSTLHAELLIYVFLGGLGIFKLVRTLDFSALVAYTIAISYMFCGFITDSGQILAWVSCAGFLPYTYRYAIQLCTAPSPASCIKFAGANYLLLVAGGYPFFFIANMYFLGAAFIVFLFTARRSNQAATRLTVLKFALLSIVLLSLVSAAPILSFIDLMPFYARGEGLALKDALFNSFSPQSFLSFLFPFAVTREHADFGNNIDISRNIYIGILLLPFVVVGLFKQRTLWWNTVLVLAMLAVALSLADVLPFRKWAYWYLPLMDSFRHPANFRLFVMVALLLFAGKGLNQILTAPGRNDMRFSQQSFIILIAAVLVLAVWFFPFKAGHSLHEFSATASWLKRMLEQIDIRKAVLMSFFLQLPFLITGYLLVIKRKYKWLCIASILNVIVAAQPQLFTGTVGNYPTREINHFIRSEPAGFPVPDVAVAVGRPDEKTSLFHEYKAPLASFFNKKVTINTLFNNPTILKSYKAFLSDSLLVKNIQHYPFAYVADTKSMNPAASAKVKVIDFTPNGFRFQIKSNSAGKFVVLQNHLPGWTGTLGGKKLPIETINHTFMGMQIPAGNSMVHLQYQPKWLLPGIVGSFLGMAISALLLLKGRKRRWNKGEMVNGTSAW